MTTSVDSSRYFVPNPSYWPLVGSVALFFIALGAGLVLNGSVDAGRLGFLLGNVLLIAMLFGWFGVVIRESVGGLYNPQVDRSFRWGMVWFIVSEVMFFAAFFGALLYARLFSVPWLGGEGIGVETNALLWQGFEAVWPFQVAPDGDTFGRYEEIIPAFGLPAINTLILLSSGVTVTLAHWALKRGNRTALLGWLLATVLLGLTFLIIQAGEYIHAYQDLGLRLDSGIYGTTFFMLTGFHGLHVTLGTLMLFVIWVRVLRGHFTADNHFGFEAVAWYWHFVDVVWLLLFVFVYWL